MRIMLTAIALVVMCGCSEESARLQRCVDANGIVTNDQNCSTPPPNYLLYRWYFGGRGYYPGERVSDGSYDPPRDGGVLVSSREGAEIAHEAIESHTAESAHASEGVHGSAHSSPHVAPHISVHGGR